MIVEFYPEKIGETGLHVLSGQKEDGSFWRIELSPGLNDLVDDQVVLIRGYKGIESYTDRGAIVFRVAAVTPFSRTVELEQLYESQGYTPIAKIATDYGISKPATGWKDAIALIVKYEEENKPLE